MRGLPCFILGQSMGGAVTLKVHFKDPHGWDGIILVAPMCKVSSLFVDRYGSTRSWVGRVKDYQ